MIVISSNSIDELNLIYKKVKRDFNAVDQIKINSSTLEYELKLERPRLNNALVAIAEKVVEIAELMEEEALFEMFTWEVFLEEIEENKSGFACLKPLQNAWKEINDGIKKAFYEFLCATKDIEPVYDEMDQKLVA